MKLGDRLVVYAGGGNGTGNSSAAWCRRSKASFPDDAVPTLVLLAEDLLQQARLRQRTRTWEHCTIAGVVGPLAQALGLTPRIDGFTADLGTQVQGNESDLAFLRRLLAQVHGEIQVVGSELHIAPRQAIRRSQVTLRLHSQLRRARVLADLAHQVTQVVVAAGMPPQGRRISGRCSRAGVPGGAARAANCSAALSGDRSIRSGTWRSRPRTRRVPWPRPRSSSASAGSSPSTRPPKGTPGFGWACM